MPPRSKDMVKVHSATCSITDFQIRSRMKSLVWANLILSSSSALLCRPLMLATGSTKLNVLVKRSPHTTPLTSQSSPLPPGTPPHLLHPTPLLSARTRIKISPLKSPLQRTPPHLLQTSPMSLGRMGNFVSWLVQGTRQR